MPRGDDTVRIAVLPGDGIGREVTDAALAVLEPLGKRHGLGLSTETLPAGAFHFRDTGEALPDETFRRAEAADVILLDPHESGGCWTARKSAAIAEAAGISVGLHSGSELGISQAAYLHLAASIPNMNLAIDTGYAGLVDDVIVEPHRFVEGGLPVPTGPGLGVELDVEKLRRYRTDQILDAYGDRERPRWFTEKPAY